MLTRGMPIMLSKDDHITLSVAIQSGDAVTVASFVKQCPEVVNHPDWTPPPLHCAILWSQPAIAELLLDSGADIEMRDPDRQTTPLRYAIMFGKTDSIPLLLSRGASTQPIVENGTSALELALEAADGAYEEYDDLPSRDTYRNVVRLLQECGLTE